MRLFSAVGSEHLAKGAVLADHSGRLECLLKATAIFTRSISTHKQVNLISGPHTKLTHVPLSAWGTAK
jgi:hypothetical protein